MIEIIKAAERGRASFGWLDSQHTFSFGHYYNPKQMGFSELRVINDDIVKPGAGFDTHGHKDMEIISLVLEGRIAHKDSEGHVQELPAGEFQLMSAGRGIYHSEYNASDTDNLRFLQIWIQPNSVGGKPGYQQKPFEARQGLTAIATPDGSHGTLQIKQDTTLSQLILAPGTKDSFRTVSERHIYVHVISGQLSIDGTTLAPGDGAKISETSAIALNNKGEEPVRALIFDLP